MYNSAEVSKCSPQHFIVPCIKVQILKILLIFIDFYFLRYSIEKVLLIARNKKTDFDVNASFWILSKYTVFA
jgi:hypothetical protein